MSRKNIYAVENIDGAPRITVNGERISPVLYGLSDFPAAASNTAYAQRNIAAFKKAGIDLVNIDTELRLGWHKVSPFDPEALIAEVANVLDVNPDAKVLIRLHMNAPYWWMRDNPDECVIYRRKDGDVPGIDDGDFDRLIMHDGDGYLRVSFASEKWLDEVCEVLAQFCDALSECEEGNAVLGIQVACGTYGEWHQWGGGDDVSAPMQRRFKRFLREKYGSDEALAKAWNQPEVTIETAEYHPERFTPGDEGNFRDPQKSRCMIDSRECLQTVPAENILRFCKIIKEHLPSTLAGTFYGYYLGCSGDHLQVERLYEAKGIVDFICGPFCYLDNRKADGVPMQRGLLESSRLRGMLWLTEMDQHPEGSLLEGGDATLFPATVATLRRNVIQPLGNGHGLWYYDHRVIPKYLDGPRSKVTSGSIYRKIGWWEEDALMNEITRLQTAAERITRGEFKPVSDVLLVYDKKSFYYRTDSDAYTYRIHDAVARCGVAYDCIYADELEVAELERYKCVIFVNAYMITSENREKYRRLLANTKTMWLYAQGYCDGDTLDCENLSKTVGVSVEKTDGAKSVILESGERGGVLMNSETIEIEKRFIPMFAAKCEAGVIPLAYYDNGEIAAAMKENDIWFALPFITRGLMESILRMCGVHIYCESGDPILAGGGIVAINSPSGGMRRIELKNRKVINVGLPPYSTFAFDAQTGERII